MAHTTANLISSVNIRSFAPSNQLTFTPSEILSIADEEIKANILPAILSVREEYFVTYIDYAIEAGKVGYDIPSRAVGMVVRDVKIIRDNMRAFDIPRREPEDILSYGEGTPTAFYIQGNQVMLDRTPSATQDVLRVYFYIRPSALVEVGEGARITNIDLDNSIITVAAIPNAWTTGVVLDLISSSGGHECLSIDNTTVDVSANQITLSSLPKRLRVGDYVALAGESPLVQIPPDFQPALAQLVAATMLESMSQPGASEAAKKAQHMLETATKLLTPRVRGEDRRILPVNWL